MGRTQQIALVCPNILKAPRSSPEYGNPEKASRYVFKIRLQQSNDGSVGAIKNDELGVTFSQHNSQAKKSMVNTLYKAGVVSDRSIGYHGIFLHTEYSKVSICWQQSTLKLQDRWEQTPLRAYERNTREGQGCMLSGGLESEVSLAPSILTKNENKVASLLQLARKEVERAVRGLKRTTSAAIKY